MQSIGSVLSREPLGLLALSSTPGEYCGVGVVHPLSATGRSRKTEVRDLRASPGRPESSLWPVH